MDHEQRQEEIFSEAIKFRDRAGRDAYVSRACGNDQELLAKVQSLLHHHDTQAFLDSPPVGSGVTLDDSPLTEGPGTVIGRYKLLQQIGEGGFGVVYMAEQEKPIRRRVALKIIKLGMDTKQVIARFEAERQALALMEHPNIAKVLDAGATDTGRPYFVMELVKGVPITKYCDSNNLSTEERLKLFIDVCKAVQHAHQKGIIHRDIKPTNVMITLRDGVPVPKVIDFGIAKATQHRLTEKTLFTEYHQFIGTPEYMSPEQAEMSELDVDTRSDIYSLGVLLYELLTGTTPFDAKELRSAAFDEIVRIIRETEPPKPSTRLNTLGDTLGEVAKHRHAEPKQLCKLIRGELDWLVMKTLEKDRTRRYETANELARDVERFLSDEPVTAGPPSTVYRIKKFVRRNRTTVAVVLSIAAALIIGLALTTVGFVQASRERNAAERARGKEAAARTQAEQAEGIAQEQRQHSERLLARAQLERGVRLLNEGDGLGLLDLLEAWKTAEEISDLRDSIGRLWAIAHDLWSGRLVHVMPNSPNLTISPQGKLLATASGSTAQLWDTATWQPHGPPLQLEKIIGAVVFNPDGQLLVTHSLEGVSQLYHTVTGQARGPILRHDLGSPKREFASWRLTGAFWSADFSPDGKLLATAYLDGAVQLWETTTGEPLQHENVVWTVAFSPDGRLLATGSSDGTGRLWEVTSGQPHGSRLQHEGWICKVVFSPDGKLVATNAHGDGTAGVWKTDTGQLHARLCRGGFFGDVVFSPNSKLLATASVPGWMAQLWDTATGKTHGEPLLHEGRVGAVAFSPDGRLLATGSMDGTARLWEVASGKAYGQALPHLSLNPTRIAFSPNGEFITTTAWDVPTQIWRTYQQFKTEVVRHRRGVGLGAISPDGKVGAIILGDTVQLWDTATVRPLGEPLHHDGGITALTFSPDGKLLATGVHGVIHLWNVASGQPFGPPLKTHSVLALAFSPDGKLLVNGATNWVARVFEVATGRRLHALGCGEWVWALAFSPDGKILATGTGDGMIKLWDLTSGKQLFSGLRHRGPIKAVAYSPDGSILATSSGEGGQAVRIWDISTAPPYQSLALPPLAVSGKEALESFSIDGTLLVRMLPEGKARVWRVPEAPTDLREMQVRTWVALGAQRNDQGEVTAIPWEQWQALREELRSLLGQSETSDDYYVPIRLEPDREAELVLIEKLDIHRCVLGEEHPDTLRSMNNLIEFYEAWGKTEQAEQWRAKLEAEKPVEKEVVPEERE